MYLEIVLNQLKRLLRFMIKDIIMPFIGKSHDDASNAIVISKILVCDRMDMVLFCLGSTNLYVFVKFAFGLDMVCDMLESYVYVSSSIGDSSIET